MKSLISPQALLKTASPSVWRVWIEIGNVGRRSSQNPSSPSVWRVWIEISLRFLFLYAYMSPSVWRVWIEIHWYDNREAVGNGSPSVWRVWIEINPRHKARAFLSRHPPCGGCGLKFVRRFDCYVKNLSPSVWRVWIEILSNASRNCTACVTLRVEGVD